jgi:hypothetical protein
MRRNCFDPVSDIAEQPKTVHWIEKITSFNMMGVTGEGRIPTDDLGKLFLLKFAYFSFDEFYKRVGVFSLILTELIRRSDYV